MKILFVCLGNICRSPAAEGILKAKLKKIPSLSSVEVASCGIGPWHVGEPPDPRMQDAALAWGVELTSRAQQFSLDLATAYDLILAADRSVYHQLLEQIDTLEFKEKLYLINHFHPTEPDSDVPDPYRGNAPNFLQVMDILSSSCQGIIAHLLKCTPHEISFL